MIKKMETDQLELAANMLKAIAHPMRISILSLLKGNTKLTVKEIHEKIGIEQASTSHHLGILKDKGVLLSHREGRNIYYYLRYPDLSKIVDCVSNCCTM